MVEIEWLTWKSASDHFDCDSFASLCHGSEVCPSHLDSDRLTMRKNEAAPVILISSNQVGNAAHQKPPSKGPSTKKALSQRKRRSLMEL
jgi:hypothetical protein